MTITRDRPRTREYSMREVVRYVVTRDVERPSAESADELRDIGSPGGPVAPRGQVKPPR